MTSDVPSTDPVTPDRHRQQASYLYGLIVSGSVLAAASDTFRVSRIAVGLLGTLAIYWAAETYVNLMAARASLGRPLVPAERRQIMVDGWPLVTACAVPIVLLLVEGALGMDTSTALDVALLVNAVVLVMVGYSMSRASGLTGWRLLASAAFAGMLGVALVGLKTLLH